MMCGVRLTWLAAGFAAFVLGATGCKDDDPGAAESDSGTEGDSATEGGSDSDSGLPTSCSVDEDCNDGNECRVGTCGADSMCTFEPIQTVACRPNIDIDFPPRAATVESTNRTVTVVGSVTSLAGPIETLAINGSSVDVSSDGSFSYDMDATYGGNTIVADTTDVTGATRRRVQSFLFSDQYAKPDAYPTGIADQGLGLYLDQVALDDDAPGQPIDDLASVLNIALQGFDVSSFFDSEEPIAEQAGYDIYLTSLSYGSTSIDLSAIDGGIALNASLVDIVGDLDFDCPSFNVCSATGGSGTGGLDIDELTVRGNLLLSVTDENTVDVQLTNVDASIDDLNLYSDNSWTNFLLGLIEPFILGGVVSDLEGELENQINTLLGPLLADSLSGLSLNNTLPLPNLAGGEETIDVDLATDFFATDIHDGNAPPDPSPNQGAAFVLRGGGYAATPIEPYDNKGVPLRNNCGEGGMVVSLPRLAPIEIGLTDDLLNQILHGAWNGGLLQFPFSGIEDNALVSNVVVDISGMLAPTASDCNAEGRLLTHIGDIRIDASLTLGDTPVTFVAFTTLVVELNVSGDDEGIGIGFTGVDSVVTELNVNEDNAIDVEETLIGVLEDALVDTLLTELGGGSLGGIELPVIDLSGQLGLPPGTAALSIAITGSERVDGTTLLNGEFGPPPPPME